MVDKNDTEAARSVSIAPIKGAMSFVVLAVTGMTYILFGERSPVEGSMAALTTVFVVLGGMASVTGIYMGAKARNGAPTAVVSAATFEVCTLLAFIYVAFLNTDTPLWVVPVIGVYSILMIWTASPQTMSTPPASTA